MSIGSTRNVAVVVCLVLALGLLLFIVLLLVGPTAEISVVRVKPDDYQTKGFRYYIPRPYLVVKKEFPIGAEACFVRGKLEGDKISEIETRGVPASIQRWLGWESSERGQLGVGQVVKFVLPQPAPEQPSHEFANKFAPIGDSVAVLPSAPWLGKSRATPETLQVDDPDFAIALVVAADNELEAIEDSSLEVGIVPLAANGEPELAAFIPCAKFPSLPFTKDTELTYTATGRRKDVVGGPTFKLALRFVGTLKKSLKERKTYLAIAPKVGLTVVGAAPAGRLANQVTKSVEETSPSAKGTISGDPSTPVVNVINELFDLMYLPDFEEQYAVHMKAGLGDATLKLGLENGWLVESATVTLDNKELGNFIFKQIDRVTSAASDLTKAYLGMSPKAVTSDEAQEYALTTTNKSNQEERWVLLKITYSIEALPGIYPLLKPNEFKSPASGDTTYLQLPAPPFTLVPFNVRRSATIELVKP